MRRIAVTFLGAFAFLGILAAPANADDHLISIYSCESSMNQSHNLVGVGVGVACSPISIL
ncbi:hypothetical protein [Streptomyces noursei]|uniref:hypothetical protein n=1 Tax=Streptomyces noursei TaxID=1971 RepID=UPI0030F2099C